MFYIYYMIYIYIGTSYISLANCAHIYNKKAVLYKCEFLEGPK